MVGMDKMQSKIGGMAVEVSGEWFVLHTRSRQEKVVARDLRAMDIAHYLPLVDMARYYGRRRVMVQLPLFPGYLFLWGSLEEAFKADRTKRLANLIKVKDQRQIDADLQSIYRAQQQGGQLDPHPYLQKGQWVEVRSGPFKGIQGIIEDRPKHNRLILQVEVLGRASSLEIDGALLDPLGRASPA